MSSDSDYEEPRNQPDVAVNGLSCETLQFESIYNSKGYRILLRAGSKQLLDPHLHEANSCHAALVYTKFWLADKKDSYSELRIQSPHMKTALKQIVSEYQHLNVDIQHIILRNEPRCLFYHRKDLINYRISCMQQGKTQAAQHIQYMIDYMFNILMVEASNFRYLVESVTENPKLDFISLWMAFVPGELIYFCRKTGDQPLSGQLFRLKSIDRYPAPSLVEPNTPWLLNGHLIDYDGTHFGHTEFDVHLHHFEGVNILHELEAVPLKYHPHAEAIRAKFSERGKTFTTFHNYHFKGYNGIALTKSKSIFSSIVGLESHHVNDRVIIDAKTFGENLSSLKPIFAPKLASFKPDASGSVSMSDEDYLICCKYIPGYSLNDKVWCLFEVELVIEVDLCRDAFNCLLLKESYKQMILSLVESHQVEDIGFDDFVQGKGKGLVFLLHGPPGTGKTLTAEGIADHTKLPLLKLDSGELGESASNVERSLTNAFKWAARWKAVVLLDEADIFLYERSDFNIKRNALVSVFLRLLEYYEGILFLTTNRIQVFDPAFKSRIHLAIKYPPLNKRHRQTLWKSLLARAIVGELPPVVTDLELASLKDKGLNGRQVKNVVRIASTLASNHGIPVNVTHLRSALKVMQTFDRDFENPRSENRGNIQQSKVIVQDSDSEAPNSVDVSDDVEATDSDYTDSVDCGGSGPEAEEESKAEDRSDGEAMVRPTKRVRLW